MHTDSIVVRAIKAVAIRNSRNVNGNVKVDNSAISTNKADL